MSATPTLLTFRNALISRLQTITTANGYNFSPRIETIERAELATRSLPAIVVGDTAIVEVLPGHLGASRGTAEIVVTVAVDSVADGDAAVVAVIRLADDVMRCVHAVPANLGVGVGPMYATSMLYASDLEGIRNYTIATVAVRAPLAPLY